MKDQAFTEILKIVEKVFAASFVFLLSERDCEEIYECLIKGAANIEDEASRQKVIDFAENFKSTHETPDDGLPFGTEVIEFAPDCFE